jgi:hypothetical protein
MTVCCKQLFQPWDEDGDTFSIYSCVPQKYYNFDARKDQEAQL